MTGRQGTWFWGPAQSQFHGVTVRNSGKPESTDNESHDSLFNLKLPRERTYWGGNQGSEKRIYLPVVTLWWSLSMETLLPSCIGSCHPVHGLPCGAETLGTATPMTHQYGNIRVKPSLSYPGQFWKVIPSSDGQLDGPDCSQLLLRLCYFLPCPSQWWRGVLFKYILYAKLHLRVCFLENQTCDRRRENAEAWSWAFCLWAPVASSLECKLCARSEVFKSVARRTQRGPEIFLGHPWGQNNFHNIATHHLPLSLSCHLHWWCKSNGALAVGSNHWPHHIFFLPFYPCTHS